MKRARSVHREGDQSATLRERRPSRRDITAVERLNQGHPVSDVRPVSVRQNGWRTVLAAEDQACRGQSVSSCHTSVHALPVVFRWTVPSAEVARWPGRFSSAVFHRVALAFAVCAGRRTRLLPEFLSAASLQGTGLERRPGRGLSRPSSGVPVCIRRDTPASRSSLSPGQLRGEWEVTVPRRFPRAR